MSSRSANSTAIWVALIGAIAIMAGAIFTVKCDPSKQANSAETTPRPVNQVPQETGLGRLMGTLTDRTGTPIGNINVSVRNGPLAKTDSDGKFVLNNVPAGDQWVEVQASATGRLTRNVSIVANKTTNISFVYDAATSRLGLLSIVAPIDGSLFEIIKEGSQHRSVVYGRCDGLSQVLGNFDVWILVSSQKDSRFWVQHPPALIDATTDTWRARALFGSAEHPPTDGENWDIVAVAAASDSEIKRVVNTPSLSMLPQHVRSNVVTVEVRIAP